MVLNLFVDWVPVILLDAVASLSFLSHFSSISKGVVSLQDLLYFLSMIFAWLFATRIVIEMNQAR